MLAVLVVALVLLTRSAEANDDGIQGSTSSMNFTDAGNSTGVDGSKTSAVLSAIVLDGASLSSVDLTKATPLAEATPPTPAAAEPAPAPVDFDMTEYSGDDSYATQEPPPYIESEEPGHLVYDPQMSTYSGDGFNSGDKLFEDPQFASSDLEYQPVFYGSPDEDYNSFAGQDPIQDQFQIDSTLGTDQFSTDPTERDTPQDRAQRQMMYESFAQKSRQAKAKARTYRPKQRYNAPSTTGAAWRPAKGTFYGNADASGTMGRSISLTYLSGLSLSP